MGSLTAHWSWDPSLIYVAVAGLMYVIGGLRPGTSRSRRPNRMDEHLRELAFFAGLVSIVIALDSPIDYYSKQLFWVHMGQHIILLTVAPPLILHGPSVAADVAGAPAGLAHLGRTHARPREMDCSNPRDRQAGARRSLLFNVNMLLWHIPAAYNLTLNHQWIHNCEHALFFFTGLLFWAHVVDPGPLRAAHDLVLASGLRHRRDDRRLGARDHAGPRQAPAVSALRGSADSAGRILSAHRPADRGWDDVGAGLCLLLDRAAGDLLSLGES